MELRITVREATALDIEPIAELLMASFDSAAEGEESRIRDLIQADLTTMNHSTYWVASTNEAYLGAIKVSALGPGFDTLIGMEWLVAGDLEIGARLVAASLGEGIPVETWVYDDAGVTHVEQYGFQLTGKYGPAPQTSLFPGKDARQAVRS